MAVSFSLAACGDSTAAPESAPEEKRAIDVWLAEFPFPGYLDPRKQMAEEFNELHPEYQINVRGIEFWELPQEVAAAAERGEAPDLANYYYNATQIARDAVNADGEPLFTSVEAAIDGRQEILGEPVVTDDLLPAVRDYYTYQGELVSMPLTAMTSMVHANTTLLDEAGVAEIPRTWEELEAACAAIAELPDGPPHCVTWPDHGWFFQQAAAQQGALLADNDNGRSGRAESVDLTSDPMIDYVEWWQRLNEDGHYLYTGTQGDWGGSYEAFVGQQVALVFDSANQAGPLLQAGAEAGFDVGTGPLPHNGDTSNVGSLVTGDSLWLADGLDEDTRDGALAFAQFLNNPQNTAEWHRNSYYLPITGASIDLLDEEGWFEQNPAIRAALDQINAADGSPAASGPVLGAFNGIESTMTQAMEEVLVDNADPRERFAQAEEEAQALLDDYGAQCVGAEGRGPDCLVVGPLG